MSGTIIPSVAFWDLTLYISRYVKIKIKDLHNTEYQLVA